MTKQTAYLLHADPTDAMLMHQIIQPEATKFRKKWLNYNILNTEES